jgi:hypothetical protein
MSNPTLEQRVTDLEQELANLYTLLKVSKPTSAIPTSPIKSGWLDRLSGSISNEALFLEALEYGKAIRSKVTDLAE